MVEFLKGIGFILGLYRVTLGYIGIMEKKMETTTVCWGLFVSRTHKETGLHLFISTSSNKKPAFRGGELASGEAT